MNVQAILAKMAQLVRWTREICLRAYAHPDTLEQIVKQVYYNI